MLLSPSVASLLSAERGVVAKHGILAKRGVVIIEHGVVAKLGGMSPSGMALSPKRDVVIIVAAIDDGVTTKQSLVGVGSASRGDLKREPVPPGGQ